MKLLIFSDIHGDLGALERLIDTQVESAVAELTGAVVAPGLDAWCRGRISSDDRPARRSGRVTEERRSKGNGGREKGDG